jgi:hypothetical protein
MSPSIKAEIEAYHPRNVQPMLTLPNFDALIVCPENPNQEKTESQNGPTRR